MAERYVFWLDELGQKDFAHVGKKCANLGEITKTGLPVPQGFAVSVEAYKDFLSETGAGLQIEKIVSKFGQISQIDQFNELSKEIRNIVESQDMPGGLKEEILNSYRKLCSKFNNKKVAVSTRSAGPESRPGQFETYLNVIGEADVLENIKRVWASSFNSRSLAYRKQKGLPLESDPIGVAVLKMVNARAAGVLFTADPNTGDASTMIIEANWGLGESVVSGESMPDMYIVNKENLQVSKKTLGQKAKYVIFKESGIAEEDTPDDKKTSFCLSDEEVSEICKMGTVLEKHFGVAQDVEWAIDQDFAFPESIILLQTRAAKIFTQKNPVEHVVDLLVNWL